MAKTRAESSSYDISDVWQEIVPPVLIIAGAFSLLRTSRLLSLALLGGWLYGAAQKSRKTQYPRAENIARLPAPASIDPGSIDDESDSSFPASDPPSYSGSTAGAP